MPKKTKENVITITDKLKDGTFEFEELLNDFLISENARKTELWNSYKSDNNMYYFSPSIIWKCYLWQWLNKKMPKTPSLESLKIFFTGDMHQDHLIAKVFEWKYGSIHYAERKVSIVISPNEIFLTGRIDDLLILQPKSSSGRIFIPIEGKSQAGSLNYRKSPKLEHVMQLTAYLAATGAAFGYLVYVDRSGISSAVDGKKAVTAISKTFLVKFDHEVWAQIQERCFNLRDFYENDEIPPPEAKMNKESKKKQCGWCEFSKECDFYMSHMSDITTLAERKWSKVMKLYPQIFTEEN